MNISEFEKPANEKLAKINEALDTLYGFKVYDAIDIKKLYDVKKDLKTKLAELEDYQVEYFGQELSPEEVILKELLQNLDVSFGEPRVLSALEGVATLYETLIDIKEPKAFLTCKDCLVDLD